MQFGVKNETAKSAKLIVKKTPCVWTNYRMNKKGNMLLKTFQGCKKKNRGVVVMESNASA